MEEGQLASWLRTIGLEQYSQLFSENGIDLEMLPDLTERDLEKLGVLIGHRRKLLRAAAERATVPAVTHDRQNGPDAGAAGERRQLTAMFCDLQGSTELAALLDPEDMRDVIRRYRKACSDAMFRYDGYIVQFQGDGVLAYFGYPQAHEDNAERAVRAGLDIIAAIAGLHVPSGRALQARIGVATGLVVVSPSASTGSTVEQSAVGETPRLAARLQAVAPIGTVVVAASTRRLLGNVFRLRSLGNHAINGLSDAIEVWTVDSVAASESRFEAVRPRRLANFVGRDREAAVLDECWRRTCQGDGQIVLISGEPGIGKSRFSVRFSERIADQPHTRLRYQCSPYHTSSALFPVIEQLKRAARLMPDDPLETQLDKLEALLAQATADITRAAPLLAALLSLPFGDRYRPISPSASQQRRQTMTALLDQLEGLARQQPVVLLYEDVHWADATSLELLDLTIERMRHLPVLVMVTYRPEFEPIWIGLPDAVVITLGRLNPAQVRHMVGQLAGGKTLPKQVVARIVAKTDGVPLFVEELTKTVLESGVLIEEGERYRLDGVLPALAIPVTLQDSLMARLDRLSPVKEIAQVGATIGREFGYELLHVVTRCDRSTLDDALAQLERAELLFRTGSPTDPHYSFKHALVQDAAYESLLKSQRVVLHYRIASALCERFSATVETQPELVAHHFTEAGMHDEAVEWWSKAGERAQHRWAFAEASAHFRQAIDLGDRLTGEIAKQRRQLRLLIACGQALIAGSGHGAEETTESFRRARTLADEIGDPDGELAALYGLWAGSNVRGELASARELASAFLQRAERQPNSPETGVGHWMVGMTHFMAGELMSAREHLEQAVTRYDPERDRMLRYRFGQDPGVAAMFQLAMVLFLLGDVARARTVADDGLAVALETNHVPTIACGYGCHCLFSGMGYNEARSEQSAAGLFELSREHDLRSIWMGIGTFFHGWMDCLDNNRQVGLARMRDGVAYFRERGFALYRTLLCVRLAMTEAAAGEVQAALATLDAALADCERTGHRWYQAEVYRAQADILLVRQTAVDLPVVEALYMRAAAVAREAGARVLQLRAALGLARLHYADGDNRAVESQLAPIVAAFELDVELPEVLEATRLLGRRTSSISS
jgi:class 3 adenylate cyclase/predicted ATPase